MWGFFHPMLAKKRKNSSSAGSGLAALQWEEVTVPENFAVGDDQGGFYCLEEIDGVECVWEGDESSGKTAVFKVWSSLLMAECRREAEEG